MSHRPGGPLFWYCSSVLEARRAVRSTHSHTGHCEYSCQYFTRFTPFTVILVLYSSIACALDQPDPALALPTLSLTLY